MRTDDELRKLVDGAKVVKHPSMAEALSAELGDKVMDKAEASQEEGKIPTISPITEENDEPAGPERRKRGRAHDGQRSRASRSSLPYDGSGGNGRRSRTPRRSSVRRMPGTTSESLERQSPSTALTKMISSMEMLNETFAILEIPGQPACIIKRSDAMPISLGDFKLRLNGTVVCLGIDDDGAPRWADAENVWRESAVEGSA